LSSERRVDEMRMTRKLFEPLVFSIFALVLICTSLEAVEIPKETTDSKEVLEEIEKVAADDLQKVNGKIESIEVKENALTVELEKPESGTTEPEASVLKVFVDKDTLITNGKERLNLADLSANMEVKVIYKNSWLGKYEAQSIIVK
jgi:hypothetical protein